MQHRSWTVHAAHTWHTTIRNFAEFQARSAVAWDSLRPKMEATLADCDSLQPTGNWEPHTMAACVIRQPTGKWEPDVMAACGEVAVAHAAVLLGGGSNSSSKPWQAAGSGVWRPTMWVVARVMERPELPAGSAIGDVQVR